MFALPLGIDGRTKRFPMMTLIIVAVTFVYSAFRFDAFHEEMKSRFTSPSAIALYMARAKLTVAVCGQTELNAGECDFLKALVQDEPRSVLIPMSALDRWIQQTYRRPLEVKKARAKSAKYLADDVHWENSQAPVVPEWAAYKAALETERELRTSSHSSKRILSGMNFGILPLLDAQFSHAGWMHLIGNMLMFLLLAFAIEERVGSLQMLCIYILGGGIALGTQVLVFKDQSMMLLGASGSVCCMAGLFLVIFFRAQMRIWISFMYLWNKTAIMPTWVFIPIFLIAQDIVGLTSAGTNVAHFAHLMGFGAGAVSGMIVLALMPLPPSFLFSWEEELLNQAVRSDDETIKLKLAHEVLSGNPRNQAAQDLLLETILKQGSEDWKQMQMSHRNALRIHFGSVLNQKLNSLGAENFLNFVERFPDAWPIASWIQRIHLSKLHQARHFAEQSHRIRAEVFILKILISFARNPGPRAALELRLGQLQGSQSDESAVS